MVTGGCGFIGSHFVQLLLEKPKAEVENIFVLDNLTYASNANFAKGLKGSERVKLVQGNIGDYRRNLKFLKHIDVVVNFAAESHVDNSINDPSPFFDSNTLGMHKILHASMESSVKTFIQISTDEVYGSIPSGSFSEESPMLPNSPYAASKASAEMIARSYWKTYGMDIRVTRTCNNFGIRQHSEKFIPVVIQKLSQNLRVPIYGTGLNTREWISVQDNCFAIDQIIQYGQAGDIYNIGSGFEISNLELAELICKMMNKDFSNLEFVSDRPGHDFRYSINSEKFKKKFGNLITKDFESELANLIRYYSI